MKQDVFGQENTLNSQAALNAWNKTMLAFLAHGRVTPTHLAKVLEHEPHFALGLAVKGLFSMLMGRKELVETARQAYVAAQNAIRQHPISQREQCYVAALKSYLEAELSVAIAHLETALLKHPGDSLAMKLSHAIRFVIGDNRGMRRSVERVLAAHGPDHPGRGYALGCHAFSLEETGNYARAQNIGREGLSLCGDDAWGLHAVAHVYEMTCDAKGGIDWLSGREAAWEHCNNFRYHVWWHKALMHLDLGQADEVLALYDTQIRCEKSDDYRDIANATSLLSRLELEGIDIGDRWDELADISMTRTEDGCLIFADLHYLLALIGGQRDDAIQTLMARLNQNARSNQSYENQKIAKLGLNAACGLEAFGRADYEAAFLNLARARQTMHLAGGSHAQRDVFERLTIDAGIRAGFVNEAEIILKERLQKRSGREDAFTAVRLPIISRVKHASTCVARVPAE